MADAGRSGGGWRVFISHTSEMRQFPEPVSYVEAVERAVSACGHVIVNMADFPVADQVPAELCVERVRGCDVYVGVLGTRWGSPVRDRTEVSYTELEFEAATEANLDRLMFMLDERATDVGIPLSALLDREFGTRQDAFRQRVKDAGLVIGSFANPDMLGRLVERSLRSLKPRQAGPAPGPQPQERARRVWNVPARNPGFTGRDGLLAAVRERLLARDKAVVQALHGMGGVGKTQLAIEYAHRYADGYDLAWWVNAEQAGLIGDQFAALGAALGCVQPGAATEVVRAAVLGELGQRDRWLLVFDNAENPADIIRWLPGGDGDVLITSRERNWAAIAVPVEVDVLARAESVTILRDRVAGLTSDDADQLADELGDLPLAIAQAAGFMAETGMGAARYLGLLRTRAGEVLAQAAPDADYPHPLAAATGLIVDRLAREDPAAAELASLCAFLAPEPIPEDLFTGAASQLPDELARRAVDPLAWGKTLAHLARQSLARIDHRGLVMHRLTQAVLRDRLVPAQAAATRQRTEALLAATEPGDTLNPATWPRWARLMPHLLAADLAGTDNAGLRWLSCRACYYLVTRGDVATGHDLASYLREHWRERLGDDDDDTLWITIYLAWALYSMGRYAEARALDEDALARCRRVRGEDDFCTLACANNLANDLRDLGEVQAARELDEDTLERRRRVLGEDDRDALISASNLALDLRALGEVQAARELEQDTLDRRRRALGDNHPDTLSSASNLAYVLRDLEELQSARELDQDTLERRRRILSEDHPSTLASATDLAYDLRLLGEAQAALDLELDTLERRRRVLGEDHPSTLATAENLAYDLRTLGDFRAARELDQDTLERRRRVLGEDHPDTVRSVSNLSADLAALGEAAESS